MALIGVSHKRGGAAALESWQNTFSTDDPFNLTALGFRESVPVVTCNRWDVVLSLPEGLPVDEARRRLTPREACVRPYAYLGEAALEQLIRIAASLDSLNPGEDQIMKQVREAFAMARALDTTGPTTSFAFHAALRIAKRVRREVALSPMNNSLFSLARPELERALPHGGVVAVLGVGAMGTLAAKTLATQGNMDLLLVNRGLERARQLARHLGAQSMSLTAFLQNPPQVDALICATPVKDLLDEAVLAKLSKLVMAVDLGLPRNIKAAAAQARNLRVLDVDSLQLAGQARREELAQALAEAEHIVQQELELELAKWTERQLGASIKRLRDWYLVTIGDLLPEEEAAKLAHKFAHVPVKGLRAVAREHGLAAAQTFLAETGLNES